MKKPVGDIPMYKHTVIFYPHIVKQYETIDQFVTENGYDDYIAAKREEIGVFGFDIADATRYAEALSDDGFEGKTTVVFDSEAHYNECIALVTNREYTMKKPIFEEDFHGDSEEHLM